MYITFSQNGRVVIEYASVDEGVSLSGTTVTLSMSVEETGLFDPNAKARGATVQCNVIKDGVWRATVPVLIPVHANLKAEGGEA